LNTAQLVGSNPQSQGWVCTTANTPSMTNNLTPLQKGLTVIEAAYHNAAQSVTALVNAVTDEATEVMSGVAAFVETAVSELVA
jgi:hypothetical protein